MSQQENDNKKHLLLVKLTWTQISIYQELQALSSQTDWPLSANSPELRDNSQAQRIPSMTQPIMISKQGCSLSQTDFHFGSIHAIALKMILKTFDCLNQ